jgi:hypothetical protein
MAAWSQLREGRSTTEGRVGFEPRDFDLQGEHLHYDRAARAWRTHAELAETPGVAVGAAGESDPTPVGAR